MAGEAGMLEVEFQHAPTSDPDDVLIRPRVARCSADGLPSMLSTLHQCHLLERNHVPPGHRDPAVLHISFRPVLQFSWTNVSTEALLDLPEGEHRRRRAVPCPKRTLPMSFVMSCTRMV